LDEVQKAAGKVIVDGYRTIGAQNQCAPTAKTSDRQIVEIYRRVATAFQEAAGRRGEHIPALYLNSIVMKFFQVHEIFGERVFDEHLQYELEKYTAEGLRADYKQDLHLF
jgi:hypothetical protein